MPRARNGKSGGYQTRSVSRLGGWVRWIGCAAVWEAGRAVCGERRLEQTQAYCIVCLREQVTWVAYDLRMHSGFQRHAQLGDITRPRPVAAQLLYARCRSSAAAEQALSTHRRGQVQDAPKCARVRVIVVAAAAGAVLLRPVPWSDAALRQP